MIALLGFLFFAQDVPKDGLAAWLDAASLRDDGWPDAAKADRVWRAPAAGAMPRRVSEKGATVARFDGRDDRVAAPLAYAAGEFTLVVVASAHANPGGYRAIASGNATGKNDYTSGLNLDLGGAGSAAWSTLNAEGAGFGREKNLLGKPLDLGTFHVISLVGGPLAVVLRVDGRVRGVRERSAPTPNLAEFRLGARHYSNSEAATSDSGFFQGDIAEFLLYGRGLKGEELESLERHLAKKHEALLKGQALVVAPVSPVTMVVPGFAVKKLPVLLTNINNVEYAPDGRLIALGYDGRIHALRDTDGDGLEDEVKPWWYQGEGDFRGPIGMVLAKEGIYVASKGKVTLVRDRDGDGQGDSAETVATGWQEITQAVDTIGLALDKDGCLYFGLGCANYANAFLLDKEGKAHYDLKSERGTILKLSRDRKSREIVCNGVRFTVGMAFNRHGDLFVTDQEGETWMPNGNPLDEVIHIQPGRNYGFPPPHPQHNPGVVDQPAVVNFGPQHQSTCGIKFNEGPKPFGPPEWEGDAFVAGESRGKIWRVPMVKTPAGYVGKHALIAALSMLTIDVAVSPKGDLVTCCHSGPPDWGTGPKGEGSIFKILRTDSAAPIPVAAWPAGPLEVKVAFDRPVEAKSLGAAEIVFGEYVSAGDRHEVMAPPYKVLEEQRRAPRVALKVTGRELSTDGRTLTLSTGPHPWMATYALALGPTDLSYDLSGATATVGDWKGWVPHVDPEIVRGLTRGSAEHERYLAALEKGAPFAIESQLLLPGKRCTLRFSTSAGIAVRVNDRVVKDEVTLDVGKDPIPLLIVGGGGVRPEIRATWQPEGDPFVKPLRLEHLLLPWAQPHRPPKPAPVAASSAGARGNWAAGKALFFGEAKCGQCHSIRGEGGKAAPDLGNLVHWDHARIMKEILEPSATINPDYVNHKVELKDGRRIIGVVLPEGPDLLRIVDTDAKATVVARSEVKLLLPSSVSIMPEGYKALGEEKLGDLLAFLTNVVAQGAPPRRRAEVEALLAQATDTAGDKARPINVVLVTGPKDHGPGEHDYPAWLERWKPMLAKSPGVRVSTAFKAPDRGHWELADLMVFYFMDGSFWNDDRYKDLDAYLARGGGLFLMHSAVIPAKEPKKLAERIGLSWEPGKTKYRHGSLELAIADSPLTKGLKDFKIDDESYWPLTGDLSKVQILATSPEEGRAQAMAWSYSPGKGRVYGTLLGHYFASFDDPFVRMLLLRGMAWAAGEPLDRFKPLVTEGVTLRE